MKSNCIFLSPPHMSGEEARFVHEAFESNYIAPLGPQVDAFEREFAAKVGIPNAVAVASGTAAMPRLNTLRFPAEFNPDGIITENAFHRAGGVNIWRSGFWGVGRAFVFLKQKMLLFSLMCYNINYLVEVKKI